MSDLSPAPTPTNEQQDARACNECGGELDMHYLSCSVWAWNAAKRPLAAVSAAAPDERALRSALASVVCNAANYPAEVGAHVLGRDLSRLVDAVTAAALAARPAPVVSGEAVERATVALIKRRGADPKWHRECGRGCTYRMDVEDVLAALGITVADAPATADDEGGQER